MNVTVQDILEKLKGGYSLPVLSSVAVKLVELASDETCSANNMAELIEKDPSLTVRLMKLANSAFFQTRFPAKTLKQAITRVGFHRLRILGLSLSLRDTFPMGKVGPMDYEKFWRVSLYRALMAQSLAKHLKNCDPGEAFVAGLVLEIGLLIYFDLMLKDKKGGVEIALDSTLEELLLWEKENHGIDHRKIGEAALRFWKFPENIVSCQSTISDATESPLAKVCKLSRDYSRVLFNKSISFIEVIEKSEKNFGINQEVVNDIILTTFDQVQDIADTFEVGVNREMDLLALMEKANYELSKISEKMFDSNLPAQRELLSNFEENQGEGDGGATFPSTLQSIAHQVQNPLAAVSGFAKKLVASEDSNSQSTQYAQVILQEVLRIENTLAKISPQKNFHMDITSQIVYGVCLNTDAERYTTLSENMDPEELSRFLNRYYETIFKPVKQYGGLVSDVIGDSMMAIWVESNSEINIRKQACLAALDIVRAMFHFNKSSTMLSLPTRIGLHFGRMSLGKIGAIDHYEYRPVGDIVNTASRLEGLNKYLGTKILVSQEAHEQIDGILTRGLGKFLLSGKSKPLTVYELICRNEESSEEKTRLCRIFSEALRAFWKQSWDAAIEMFHEAMEIDGEDGPSIFYSKLCENYKYNPPGEMWTGLVYFKTK